MAQRAHDIASDSDRLAGVSGPTPSPDLRRLSLAHLLGTIARMTSELVTKEVSLAQEEAKANLKAELAMVKLLGFAAAGALLGINLLLVAVVLGLASVMPAWLAALTVGLVILVIAAVVGIIGWRRRVTRPLAITRKGVTEDLRWAKERLA